MEVITKAALVAKALSLWSNVGDTLVLCPQVAS